MDRTKADAVRSTCPYCGVGCGVLLRATGDGGLDVQGDPDHPANFGRLCSKGLALGETVGVEDRLLDPMVHGGVADWDDALQLVADRFSRTIADHGPGSVALYVSGQMLTEDYYVANKLAKGFMGTANIDTNSRLCMASTVAGHKRAFGSDTVPGTYEDLELADLIVLTGSNLAWCHPVLYQRILAARSRRPEMKIVVIDPRRTASCDGADLHLALEPGSDVALFNHLLAQIDRQGAMDRAFLAAHVDGVAEAVAAAHASDVSITGLSEADLARFVALWIGSEKVVTVFSQGVNQSTSGADKVNAILNCHLATGRIGKPGCGPFSVTGQPNAMGGREVGGLANMLACHLDLENPDHRQAVRQFWDAPQMPETAGLKAVDMFRAVGRGEIKALWIIHTNPAVSMPDSTAIAAAISGCDFTVVSDITGQTDTARLADVLLPATAWAEKDGTVTNSDRTISRQRGLLPAPGRARPDWAILAEVGRRMGWTTAFDYDNPAQIFREHAALSGIAGGFGRDFDISGMADISDADYATCKPFRWPYAARKGGRFFAEGGFFTANGKARMLPLQPRGLAAPATVDLPYRLNTGRTRDQWHTMTRSGKSVRLAAHLAEPFLEIHPGDAQRIGVDPAGLVRVHNQHGSAILRALITDRVRPGQCFAPIHWTKQTAPSGVIDCLVPGAVDPVSGQPESKAAAVMIDRFPARWYGFAVSRSGIDPDCDYWARTPTAKGWRCELAGLETPDNWEDAARRLFGQTQGSMQTLEDKQGGSFRAVLFGDRGLEAALFVSAKPVAVMRDYLAGLPDSAITGRTPVDQVDPGPTICACFGVGLNTILSAIDSRQLQSVEAIGAALQAGTNCGSCRPELAGLLASSQNREAAE
ncbi:nitrate reductase [Flavimaricola marinus]|uniref:Nitrate reductase n=1 Tax=Flavimaricola marinus TaxID=1819565 RepID=A0A238LIE8_9RHOB|nr:nitrate reductase [Flavimaricola marinus]SMY09175.1 Nitrate reductase [Flavimaricola marinus]